MELGKCSTKKLRYPRGKVGKNICTCICINKSWQILDSLSWRALSWMNQESMCFLTIKNMKEKEERAVAGDLGKHKNDLLCGKSMRVRSYLQYLESESEMSKQLKSMEEWMVYNQERSGDRSNRLLLFLFYRKKAEEKPLYTSINFSADLLLISFLTHYKRMWTLCWEGECQTK